MAISVDFSEYGGRKKEKEQKKSSIRVDFTEYQPKPLPTMREAVQSGIAPQLDVQNTPRMQQVQSHAVTMPATQPATEPQEPLTTRQKIERGLDYVFKDNKVARILNYPFAQAAAHSIPDAPLIRDGQNVPGTSARESFLEQNPIRSTGIPMLDKTGDVVGQLGAYGFNPAGGLGTGVIGAYRALSPVVDQVTTRATQRLPELGQRVAREGAREAAVGAAYAPVRSLIEGESDLGEIAQRSAVEGAIGGALGASFPLIGKGVSKIIDKYRPKPVEPTPPTLALPEGRLDQRLRAAEQRGVTQAGTDPIANEYQFKLPEPSEQLIQSQDNLKTALKELSDIDNEIRLLESKYQQAINSEFEYLKNSMRNREGTVPKRPIRDKEGYVVGWSKGFSMNPEWYQRLHAEKGRPPSLKRLYEEAKRRVDEGYSEEGINVPSWVEENSYAETLKALDEVKGVIRNSIRDSTALDATLKDQVLSFEPRPRQRQQPQQQAPTTPQDEFKQFQDELFKKNPEAKNLFDLDLSDQEFHRLLELRERAFNNPVEDVQAMRTGPVETVQRQQPRTTERTFPSAEPVDLDALPDRPPRSTDKSVEQISRNEVVQSLKDNLGVTIDTGRLGTSNKSVRGIFKTISEVIRSRSMYDMSTISHEVGHAIQKRYNVLDDRYRDELMNILRNHSEIDMKAYKPDELMDEGLAEYVRLLLTEPRKALEVAPNFSEHIMNKLPTEMIAGLRSSQEVIGRWLEQSGFQSAMGKIDTTAGKSTRKFNFDRFYTKMVDDLNPLKLTMNALEGRKAHLTKHAEENLYKTARMSRGTGERAKLAVERGIYNENGQKISEGMADIVKDLEKIGVSEHEFSTYLATLHAQDLKRMRKQVPFTDTEINSVLSELDSKVMRELQQRVVKYNNALLDLLVEGQVISRDTVKHLKEKYPNYVPFMRFFDDDLVDGFTHGGYGSSRGFANLSNPIKRMSEEGSERVLVDPLESIVKNTFLVMNAAEKNKVGLRLFDLSKVQGAGKIVEFLPDGKANPREHIINVKVDGENRALKIRDPDLYDAMLSLDTESSNSLVQFLSAATNVLRGGATLTPEFMVRNVFRDVGQAMVTVGLNPVNFFRGMYFALTPQLRKMGLNVANNRLDEFISSGGAMSTMMGMTRDYSREAMREAFKKSMKQKAMNVITDPKELAKFISGYTPVKGALKGTLRALRKGSEISEFSTKLGYFDQRLRKGDSLREAAYQARDLMDFNRSGSGIRQANKLIAFLNAQIQGTDKLARSIKDDPVKTLTRGFVSLTIPTIALHAWYSQMSDEQQKAFENIPQWQKDMFYIIPGPNNTFARVPKPFETGLIFSTLADRIINDVVKNDPEAWDDFATYAVETFTPPVMIQALNPILEAYSNHSFFRNAPIVPMGLERLERKDQHDIFTSETAKLIGRGMDAVGLGNSPFASPKIIDNTIRGYTAGLGSYAVSGLDTAINAISGQETTPKPAKRTEENPFLAPFMAKTQGSGDIRNKFYEKWDELSKKKASAEANKTKFVSLEYARFKTSYDNMSKLSTKYKKILNDPHMTPQEKRDKLDVIDRQMNDYASRALYPEKVRK